MNVLGNFALNVLIVLIVVTEYMLRSIIEIQKVNPEGG